MKPIRVVVIGVPALLRDILRSVGAGGAEFVEVDDAKGDVVRRVGEVNADVVLVSGDDLQIPRLWNDVLAAYPEVRVVGVASRGRRALVCEVTADMTAASLADAIRLR